MNDRQSDDRTSGDRGGGLLQSRYPEVSASSVIFAIILGAVMNAAITYAGLKIGFTIGGSAIAAVLGFGVLRGILRRGTILETNIAQTVASAVNTTNAGIIFTVPVLLLLGHKLSFDNPDFWWITVAATAGAVLGVVFIVPLRKQMLDIDRLRFPSATAVAAILKSPGAGPAKSVVLLIGVVVAMLIYLPAGLPELNLRGYASLGWRLPATPAEPGSERTLHVRVDRDADGEPDVILQNDRIDVGRLLRFPDQLQLVFAIAPFALGAGYLTGRAGLMVLAGGILAYMLLNPLAYGMGWMPQTIDAHEAPAFALGAFNRPLGIGLLLGGALMGVLVSLPAIREALRSIAAPAPARAGGADEMRVKSLLIMGAVSFGLLLLASRFAGTSDVGSGGLLEGMNPWVARGIITVVAAAWIWFAGIIIAQCTGMTDWSPISGMALLTVVLVMMLSGKADVVSAVVIGCALCVAISCAADMMADLKTGYIVGAQPRRQQVVEAFTVVIGPIITMLTLVMIAQMNLRKTDGQIAIGPGTDTVAPQAQALQAVITGVQGGEMPYALYGLGAIAGVLLGLGAFPGLGVLVGLSMYLPVHYILTYGIGCVANMVVAKVKGRTWAEEWGVPFCAGLIVGEAILALIISAIVLLTQ